MSVEDMAMTREVMRDISRHPLDTSNLQVHVTRGVLYLGGVLGKIRGGYDTADLHEELNMLVRTLRQKPGIREVICEVDLAGPSIAEQMMQRTNRAKRR